MNISNLAISLQAAAPTLDEALAFAEQLGISAITFSGSPTPVLAGVTPLSFLWDELDDVTQQAIRQLRSRFKRAVLHAPFVDVPLVSPNPYIEKESMRQILISVRAAGALDIEVVTVHALGTIQSLKPAEFEARMVAKFQQLGDAAAQANTKIGLENWRFPCDPDEHGRLLEAINHPAVGATLDVGHIKYWYARDGIHSLHGSGLSADEGIADYHKRLFSLIDRIAPYLVHLHVHDVFAATLEDHHAAGRGFLDYRALIGKLAAINFDGVLLFEVSDSDRQTALQQSVTTLLEAMGEMT